jgi:hypothetical protein
MMRSAVHHPVPIIGEFRNVNAGKGAEALGKFRNLTDGLAIDCGGDYFAGHANGQNNFIL